MIRTTLLAACAIALVLPASVNAAEKAGAAGSKAPYIGTWAAKLTQCSIAQDKKDAPMIVGAKRYDQHEVHCDFSSIAKTADAWRVKAKCTVEGDQQPDDFLMKVTGNTMVLTRGKASQVLKRCT